MRHSNDIHSTDAPIICTHRAARSTSVHRRLTVLPLLCLRLDLWPPRLNGGRADRHGGSVERDENSLHLRARCHQRFM